MTIGMKITDHKIIMKRIGPIAEINFTIETGTMPKNTKETIHTVETGHKATTKNDYRNVYRNDCRKENHRDFKDQRHKRRSKDHYNDTYDKVNSRTIHRDKGRIKDRYRSKSKYRDDSYDLGRGRSREKHYTYDARKVTVSLKLELVNNIVQQLGPNKDTTTRFLKTISEDVDDLLNNTSSVADVKCCIAKRLMYAKNLKAKTLTKDPHVKIDNTSSQNLYHTLL